MTCSTIISGRRVEIVSLPTFIWPKIVVKKRLEHNDDWAKRSVFFFCDGRVRYPRRTVCNKPIIRKKQRKTHTDNTRVDPTERAHLTLRASDDHRWSMNYLCEFATRFVRKANIRFPSDGPIRSTTVQRNRERVCVGVEPKATAAPTEGVLLSVVGLGTRCIRNVRIERSDKSLSKTGIHVVTGPKTPNKIAYFCTYRDFCQNTHFLRCKFSYALITLSCV